MSTQGTAVLDFGAFPGSNVAYVDVATVGVVATSLIEAWIRPAASADHTDTDHVAAPMKVVAQYVSDGNIRIYGINQNDVLPPLELQRQQKDQRAPLAALRPKQNAQRTPSPMFVGQFNVSWVWNT